jgi:polysaccharide biosynthesis protein PelD
MADERVIPESRERPSDWRGPRAWLMPQPDPAVAWLEILVIMLVAVGIAWLADPKDPLHIHSPFPWPWFAPVVIALRYGAVQGVASSLVLLVSWYLLTPGSLSAVFPKFHFLGGMLLVLVCAEFSSAWRLRLRRTFELNRYLEDRVERVTRRLYLLRLSHDRLEQELLSQPTTMRDAIVRLRERLIDARGPGPLPGAQLMLQFLAQHCQLEAAALHTVSPGGSVHRVARLGPAADLNEGDPLLRYVLERGELAHVQAEGVAEHAATPQLLVAPITTSDARLLGVLSVSRMPFFALNQDTLQLIDVLLGAYADALASSPERGAISSVLSDISDEFAEELARLMRIEREFSIDSRMVVFTFGEHPFALDAYNHIMRTRRAPDLAWIPVRAHLRSAMVVLLPIARAATVEGYLLRTEAGLRETFAADFAQLRIRTVTIALSDPEPVALLARALAAPPSIAADAMQSPPPPAGIA